MGEGEIKLSGQCALITGATHGLGFEIAKTFVKEGASIYICSRTHKDVHKTIQNLRQLAKLQDQIVDGCVCDIADTKSIDALVRNTLDIFPNLDILVNNAGVYGPFGTIEQVDWHSWIQAIQINLIGPIYLTKSLVEHFKTRKTGKIINISGGGATAPMPGISAYAVSKCGFVRFTETLAHELQDFGVDVNAIAPGALATRLTDEVIDAGPDVLNPDFIQKMKEIQSNGGTPLSIGARCVVYFASTKSDKISGRLISALWDKWETLHKHSDELAASDIYTLRRIVAKDRYKEWGDK